MAEGGVGDLVHPGKTMADVHECFLFGLGQDDIKKDGGGDAHGHEHQEGKRLQLLLQEQKQVGKGLVRWDGDQTQQVRPVDSALTAHRYDMQVGLRRFTLRCVFS